MVFGRWGWDELRRMKQAFGLPAISDDKPRALPWAGMTQAFGL
jgi:hypothetical protein